MVTTLGIKSGIITIEYITLNYLVIISLQYRNILFCNKQPRFQWKIAIIHTDIERHQHMNSIGDVCNISLEIDKRTVEYE